MNRKFLSIFVLLIFFVPSISQAVIFVPTANLTIIVNSQGQDNPYHFNLKQHNGFYWDDYNEFDLQTENFTASTTDTLVLWGSNRFLLSEVVPTGWNLTISCTSDNSGNVFTVSQLSPSVTISAVDGSNITCVFNNAQVSQKNPVLIVPGVLGTNILENQDKLWVNLGRMFTDVGDEFMNPLQFNADLFPSVDGLTAGDIVRKETALLGLVNFDYSAGLIDAFADQGYSENQDLFLSSYDWRYGISGEYPDGSTNVDKLQQRIEEVLDITHASKVGIVANSTGGLLVKKYVMEHPADHHIGKAVFVGVPNAGAPKAVKVLTVGDSFGIPWLAESEMKKIAQNLPVVYDLAPSQTYFDRKGSFVRLIEQDGISTVYKDLDYSETGDFLLSDHGLNQIAYNQAQDLHTLSFDDYDLRSTGVDLYNVVGCKTGTLGKFLENRLSGETTVPTFDFIPEPVPGDGTVPLESATNLPVDANKKFFALKADHAKMLSQNGIRQTIVNIVAGTDLYTPDMTADIGQCKLNGKAIAIYSPVEIEIYDQDGNRLLGRYEDGTIQNDIPAADFEVFGDHKFVYLPDEYVGIYTIVLKGAGTGTFTLKNLTIADNVVTQSENFINLSVTPALIGRLDLSGQQIFLALDTNGDGTIDETILPSAILDANESQDLASPTTTATIAGTQGHAGYYRSDVTVALSADDPVISGHEAETSGILKTQYQLDGGAWQEYLVPPPLTPPTRGGEELEEAPAGGDGVRVELSSITAEGPHTIEYFSTDRAGNREEVKTVTFTIDKTSPEAVIQFDPSKKDLAFSGTDNLSNPEDIAITDADNIITLMDQAGNTTELKFKDKNRKILLKAEIKSLSYNNQPADIGKNKLSFLWLYDKKPSSALWAPSPARGEGNLKLLTQKIQNKKNYNILATYAGKNTLLLGRDATGRIFKTVNGLVLLKVTTDKGDLGWGY